MFKEMLESFLKKRDENSLKKLRETIYYYSTICADEKETKVLLKKVINMDYQNIQKEDLLKFVENIKLERLHFRSEHVSNYFKNGLKDYLLKNHNSSSVSALMNAVSEIIIPDYKQRVKDTIKKNNEFNVFEIGTLLKHIYDNDFNFKRINAEKEVIKNSIKEVSLSEQKEITVKRRRL